MVMRERIEIPHGRRYIIERCPYCGHRLAEWFEGDTHVSVLHPKASMTSVAEPPSNGPLEGSSRCMRLRCRLRRRLDRQHP